MADQLDVPLASLGLLRRITDRHVVDQLLATPSMTRAEIAAATGISKPTISESVRRLTEDGVLIDAGRQPIGRPGRAGAYYALNGDLGVALAIVAGPDGLVAEALDIRGTVLRRTERETSSPIASARLTPILHDLVAETLGDLPGAVRCTAISVAGPVDLDTGRLVHLPNSPFLVDELDTRALLSPLVGDSLVVDNDVNWAALAEYHAGVATGLEDFCYLHLGYGVGGAVIRDGEIIHGSAGLAGEPAHMFTIGPRGKAMRLVECFGELGLLQPGTDAIDVTAVAAVLTGTSAAHRRQRDAIVEAVAGAVASMAALLNPAGIVIGGPWLNADRFVDHLADRIAELAVPSTTVKVAELGPSAPLTGTRLTAVRAAQSSLFGRLTKELAG